MKDPWFPHRGAHHAGRLRLFCFPHAGAGAAVFRKWPELLGQNYDVCAIEPPGRLARLNEEQPTSIGEFLRRLAEHVDDWPNQPVACFGYSLGALMAYEWSLRMCSLGHPPVALFVAAHRAPHVPPQLPLIAHLESKTFVEAVTRRYASIPPVIFQDESTTELFLSILRTDIAMSEGYYRPSEREPLPCPIYAVGGEHDHLVPLSSLISWGHHTHTTFTYTTFPGDHLFMYEHSSAVAGWLGDCLTHHTPE